MQLVSLPQDAYLHSTMKYGLCCCPACIDQALCGITHDIHSDIKEDGDLVAMHADAEKFDRCTEQNFKMQNCHLGYLEMILD